MLLTTIDAVDAVLGAHAAAVGRDLEGYRNHVYRVANLCLALAPGDAEHVERVAVTAAFHDLGIWTDGTFDYLEPSVRAATAYLARTGRTAWIAEVETAIREHHKVRPYRGPHALVEPFRRADWVDVTRGALAWGVPRPVVRAVLAAWPSAGFHRRLVQLTLGRLRTHPWSPLPMLRL